MSHCFLLCQLLFLTLTLNLHWRKCIVFLHTWSSRIQRPGQSFCFDWSWCRCSGDNWWWGWSYCGDFLRILWRWFRRRQRRVWTYYSRPMWYTDVWIWVKNCITGTCSHFRGAVFALEILVTLNWMRMKCTTTHVARFPRKYCKNKKSVIYHILYIMLVFFAIYKKTHSLYDNFQGSLFITIKRCSFLLKWKQHYHCLICLSHPLTMNWWHIGYYLF